MKTEKKCPAVEQTTRVPHWLVLLDNIPTVLLFILGTLIVYQFSLFVSLLFLLYAITSIVYFWAKICPYCHFFNTKSCPCGYGMISPHFFKQKTGKSFSTVFKKHIVIMYPNWFFPLVVAGYLLITDFSWYFLILTTLFCLIGFVVIPLISKQLGCKQCGIKEECPWFSKKNGK